MWSWFSNILTRLPDERVEWKKQLLLLCQTRTGCLFEELIWGDTQPMTESFMFPLDSAGPFPRSDAPPSNKVHCRHLGQNISRSAWKTGPAIVKLRKTKLCKISKTSQFPLSAVLPVLLLLHTFFFKMASHRRAKQAEQRRFPFLHFFPSLTDV